jgi:DNA methylase
MLMPEFLAALSTHLEYRWTIAWLMLDGFETRQYQRKTGSRWKPVFVFGNGDAMGHTDWIADTVHGGRREKGLHDWQQSESGFVELLKAVRAEPGQLVCDPFLGSGTTAAAARAYGCDFVGAELDPTTFRAAQLRLGMTG